MCGRIYVTLHGKGKLEGRLKAIGVYGDGGVKKYEIYTTDHHAIGLHCHFWHNGRPDTLENGNSDARPLNQEMLDVYNLVNKLL